MVGTLVSASLLVSLILADLAGLIGAPLLIAIVTMYSLTSPGSGVRVLIPGLVPDDRLIPCSLSIILADVAPNAYEQLLGLNPVLIGWVKKSRYYS
jgi:hypothetical protein